MMSRRMVYRRSKSRESDDICSRRRHKCEGVSSLKPAPPSYLLPPGGGDGCREAELVSGGDGSCDPSPGTPASGGDGCRRMPLLVRRCRSAERRTWYRHPTSPGTTPY